MGWALANQASGCRGGREIGEGMSGEDIQDCASLWDPFVLIALSDSRQSFMCLSVGRPEFLRLCGVVKTVCAVFKSIARIGCGVACLARGYARCINLLRRDTITGTVQQTTDEPAFTFLTAAAYRMLDLC